MKLLPKTFFSLQFEFASMIIAKHGIAPPDAYFNHTASYIRMLGFSEDELPDRNNLQWKRLLDAIIVNSVEADSVVYEAYLQYQKKRTNKRKEGGPCFHAHYHIDKNVYELHFDPVDPLGNLAKHRMNVRLRELRDMVSLAHTHHPEATLFARTWLFGIEAFTRLFPVQFKSNAVPWDSENKQFDNAHWGQFVDKDKNLKPHLVEAFRKKMREETYSDFNFYFPLLAQYSEIKLKDLEKYYAKTGSDLDFG